MHTVFNKIKEILLKKKKKNTDEIVLFFSHIVVFKEIIEKIDPHNF